jgi:hypothetical protein
MSLEPRPVIGALKDRVNSVVVCVEEPLAVTLEKVIAAVGAVTVTVQVAVLLPSSVLTVIVALPADTPVIVPVNPFPETGATAVLLLLHVTFLFAVLAGVIVAVIISVPPTGIVNDGIGKIMLITVTVTVQGTVKPPSTVVTVINAVPEDTAVTVPFNPLADTVAIEGALLLHDTLLLVALDGVMVAVKVSELPIVIVVDDLFKVTPVTATLPPPPPVTVTVQVAVLWPSTVVTVITALPADTALTKPLWDTVATAALPLLHITFLFVALDGAMMAVKVSELPTVIVVEVLFRDTPVTATALLPLETLTAQVAVFPPS